MAEGDELEGLYFEVFWAGLHDKTCGVLRSVDGSIGECNMEFLFYEGEIVCFGEVLVNEGYCGSRVNHGNDREGGAFEVEGDGNCDGSRVVNSLVNRRRVIKVA